MVYENPDRVEKRIKKLTREIEEIDNFFYGFNKGKNRLLHMGMLEFKRDDIVRSAVLQLHTAIEDLMTDILFSWILGASRRRSGRKRRHTKRGQALSRMLTGGGALSFDMKLNFAVVVGVIDSKTRDRLKELNTIRNKCSHHWRLDAPVLGKTRPKQKRPRLLNFRGRDLHKFPTLEDFVSEYAGVYLQLYRKSINS
jgi:uncharacterized protein YutE (UPF0331/DUF86 family)